MRTLTILELKQPNGGINFKDNFTNILSYSTKSIFNPLVSGAIAGLVIGYIFDCDHNAYGRYALAYGLGAAAYRVGINIMGSLESITYAAGTRFMNPAPVQTEPL